MFLSTPFLPDFWDHYFSGTTLPQEWEADGQHAIAVQTAFIWLSNQLLTLGRPAWKQVARILNRQNLTCKDGTIWSGDEVHALTRTPLYAGFVWHAEDNAYEL